MPAIGHEHLHNYSPPFLLPCCALAAIAARAALPLSGLEPLTITVGQQQQHNVANGKAFGSRTALKHTGEAQQGHSIPQGDTQQTDDTPRTTQYGTARHGTARHDTT